MEITGKLIRILPETRGESQRGPWVRGGFVIETDGEYPRQVAFTTFGEDRLAPESREFNERWYTDLRCSRVQAYVPGQMPPATTGYNYQVPQAAAIPATPAAPAAQPAAQPAPFAAAPDSTMPGNATMPASDDDLPF